MRKGDVSDLLASVPVDDRISGKLFDNSTHFLSGDINDQSVSAVIRWILYENLAHKSPRELTLYINSPGGDLYQAFALIDIMQASHHPIKTVGIGHIMSAAFLIFVSGTRGHRVVAKNTGIMCHQYYDAPEGKHHDLKAQMIEGEYCNKRMFNIIQQATGLPAPKIRSKLLRESDVYLTAEEAVSLGIADSML